MLRYGPPLAGPAGLEPLRSGDNTGTRNVSMTGDQSIDGLLHSLKWRGDITYSAPDAMSDYQKNYFSDPDRPLFDGATGFSPFTPMQMTAYHFGLNTLGAPSAGFSVAGFTDLGVTFRANGSGQGTIRGANLDPDTDAPAIGLFPGSAVTAGDFFMGNAFDGGPRSFKTPEAGNEAWHAMLHEIGHTLGLRHGHETGGPGGALPASVDSVEFSIMTYRTFVDGKLGEYSYGVWDAPQTFMMLDIAALQHMYGADFTTNSGNTTYKWTPGSGDTLVDGNVAIDAGGKRIFATIWDGGGVDTYDLSAYTTAVSIDLAPGAHSVFSQAQLANLGGGPNGGIARGNIFNARLFDGDTRSLIENAFGGSGNDTIRGNAAANVLEGRDGRDTLHGLNGADTLFGGNWRDVLYGGAGNDVVYGGADTDTAYGDGNDDRVYGGGGHDHLYGGNGDDRLFGGGGHDRLYGGNGADQVLGGDNDDRLYGGAGGDRLHGGNGHDDLHGGAGSDQLYGGNDDDYLYGDAGSDRLYGGAGTDRLYGGDGVDRLHGGNGVDRLYGGSGTDHLYGDAEGDHLYGGSGKDYLYGGAGNDWLRGGAGIDYLYGGAAIDRIYGEAGDDRIYGGQGNDTVLSGGAGKDFIYGGTGNDALYGGDGNDFLYGGQGNDSLYGGTGTDSAIYATYRAQYTITTTGGVTTVAHLNGAGSDGTDTLIGVEIIRFTDQVVIV